MKDFFLNIYREPRSVYVYIKEDFTKRTEKERWIYIMRAYSVYAVVIIYILNILHGLLAAQAFLFYSSASFIAVSFFVSRDLGSKAYYDKKEQTLFRHIILFFSVVFLPTAFVLISAVNVAITFFVIVLAFTLVQYFGFSNRINQVSVHKLKTMFNDITKAAKERGARGFPYTVREVGDASEGVQE